MRIIHTADLHLDSKIDGLPTNKSKIRREEIICTFERLVEYAAKNNVSAIIIAGDMFDTAQVTVKTKERVLLAIKKYSQIDFFYLSGNHDDENFISAMENTPNNLKIFSDEWSSYSYDNVVISGAVFTNSNAKTIYDTLRLSKNNYNVVVMHGQVAGYKSNEQAELISLPRLKEKNIDYLALGHIHTFSQGKIDDRANYAYSGCLDGRGFDELGDKGFILLDISDREVEASFINFSSRNLYEYEYCVDGKSSWYESSNELIEELVKTYDPKSLIKVVLTGSHDTDYYIDKDSLTHKLNDIFFYVKVYDNTALKIDLNIYKNDKSVRGEFVRTVLSSNLTTEQKNKVILCGLSALKGEEV